MKQTKRGSLYETVFSTVVGFVLSFGFNALIMPFVFHVKVDFLGNLKYTILFTFVSLTRQYFVRRYFNWRLHRKSPLQNLVDNYVGVDLAMPGADRTVMTRLPEDVLAKLNGDTIPQSLVRYERLSDSKNFYPTSYDDFDLRR